MVFKKSSSITMSGQSGPFRKGMNPSQGSNLLLVPWRKNLPMTQASGSKAVKMIALLGWICHGNISNHCRSEIIIDVETFTMCQYVYTYLDI